MPVRFTYDNNYFNARYQGIPVGGYTPSIEKLLEGVDVCLETDFSTVRHQRSVTKIIYTGAIDEYFDYCYGPLEYRSLHFENVDLAGVENEQGNTVVNYTDRNVPYTRVIEHKHFAYDQPEVMAEQHTVISKEYPMAWQVGREPYYPVNNEANNALYGKYKALARQEAHVIFGGRLGLYRYFDMDNTVRAALDCAKEELK